MKARIEIIDQRTVVSMPFRLNPAFVPHFVLIGVILFASLADMLLTTASWIGLY